MNLIVKIQNIQQIKLLTFSIDLTRNKLMGIVGRNGVGKTTLMKALQNLRSADTFKQTSSDSIFRRDSSIDYDLNGTQIQFTYDPNLASLNSKQKIDDSMRNAVDVELPMPYGKRFNFFKSISDADAQIRSAVILQEYSRPDELIDFLHAIYGPDKYNELVEISIKGIPHYCILLPENRYIREDYLSSGEYFLINLYRKIQSRCKLIAIDEIDISLDAAAQIHLIDKLRIFCTQYGVNILFTTHSLAMMQTLESDELFHMQVSNSDVEIEPRSYGYIKSTLFGFRGWERYILTEDAMLWNFLRFIIERYCKNIFFEYQIIYVGAAGAVVDLMDRNRREEFFSSSENVISILDRDQINERYAQTANVYFIPFQSVEKKLHEDYMNGQLRLLGSYETKDPKKLYEKFISRKALSQAKIFEHLCSTNEDAMVKFSESLTAFLTKK